MNVTKSQIDTIADNLNNTQVPKNTDGKTCLDILKSLKILHSYI